MPAKEAEGRNEREMAGNSRKIHRQGPTRQKPCPSSWQGNPLGRQKYFQTPKPFIEETKRGTGKATPHFRLFTASLEESSKGTMGRPIEGRGAGGGAMGINSKLEIPTPSVTLDANDAMDAMPMTLMMLPRRRKVRQGAGLKANRTRKVRAVGGRS